ncbi:MAG: DUF2079 domain-containing protein [Candidatus Bathyarchaeia archaeon]
MRFGKIRGLNLYGKKILPYIEEHADTVIWILILMYTIFFSIYTIYMHYTFRTYAWDLGIFAQSLWTTLNSGKILYSTLEVNYGNPTGNFLGVHFSPILFALLPIYAIYPSSETLLVFQSFILGVAALPLYWISKYKLQNKLYALAFATAYLLNPAIHGVNTFDFHMEIFTPVFILSAFYFIQKGRWLMAVTFIILELTTIEFAPILTFFFGLYLFFKEFKQVLLRKELSINGIKKIMASTILIIVSIFSFYLAIHVIQTINPLKKGAPPGVWSYWGSNIFEAAANIFHNPLEALTMMITPLEKPYFFIFLLASVLLLPIFAPLELIMTVPWLAAAFITDYSPYYQPYFQYSAFIVGQIFLAAIYGFHNVFSKNPNGQKKTMTTLILTSLLLSAIISPAGFPALTERTPRPYSISLVSDGDHVKKIHKVINLLPGNASVATTWEIFPHICQRLDAYFLDGYFIETSGEYPAEYILVDMKSPCLKMKIYGPSPDAVLLWLMANNEYGMIASMDGVMLLQRGYRGQLKYYEPQRDIFNYKQLIPSVGKITWDYTSTFGKVISTNPEASTGIMWFGPYRYFSPGDYEATFRLKTANETCKIVLEVVSEQGTKAIALRTIYGNDFTHVNTWQNFTLHYRINQPAELEFRGRILSNNTQIVIDYVAVKQISP